MDKLIYESGIKIPYLYYKNNLWCQNLVHKLKRKVKDYTTGIEIEMKFYITDDKKQEILVPRFCSCDSNVKLIDQTTAGSDINIIDNITLRSSKQQEAFDWFSLNDNGILCMKPGEGKTVVSIKAISYYKKKTIILLHKDSLAEQWKKRIIQFTNFEEKDISRLTTATYKKDLNKPIIISTVQTICSMYNKFDNLLEIFKKANIGIMIADEVHGIIGPEQFSVASIQIPAKRCYGLSATPYRMNNKDIMFLHLGNIYNPVSIDKNTMEPKIVVLKIKAGVMSKSNLVKWIYYSNKFSKERYLKQLIKAKPYKAIVKGLVQQIDKSGRRMLFISDRIAILDWASEAVKNQNDVGFFIPRSGKERKNHLKRKMVYSTYGSSRDGLDEPELSCLVMSTPTSNIEQCIGRVLRTAPNKKEPIVYDIVDMECEEMVNRYEYRKRFYEQKKWKIDEKEII